MLQGRGGSSHSTKAGDGSVAIITVHAHSGQSTGTTSTQFQNKGMIEMRQIQGLQCQFGDGTIQIGIPARHLGMIIIMDQAIRFATLLLIFLMNDIGMNNFDGIFLM